MDGELPAAVCRCPDGDRKLQARNEVDEIGNNIRLPGLEYKATSQSGGVEAHSFLYMDGARAKHTGFDKSHRTLDFTVKIHSQEDMPIPYTERPVVAEFRVNMKMFYNTLQAGTWQPCNIQMIDIALTDDRVPARHVLDAVIVYGLFLVDQLRIHSHERPALYVNIYKFTIPLFGTGTVWSDFSTNEEFVTRFNELSRNVMACGRLRYETHVNEVTDADSDVTEYEICVKLSPKARYIFKPFVLNGLFVLKDGCDTNGFRVYEANEPVVRFDISIHKEWDCDTPEPQKATVTISNVGSIKTNTQKRQHGSTEFVDVLPSHNICEFIIKYAIESCLDLGHDIGKNNKHKLIVTELNMSAVGVRGSVNERMKTAASSIRFKRDSLVLSIKVDKITLSIKLDQKSGSVPWLQSPGRSECVTRLIGEYNRVMFTRTMTTYKNLRKACLHSRKPLVINKRMYHPAFLTHVAVHAKPISNDRRFIYQATLSFDGDFTCYTLATINIKHGPLTIGTASINVDDGIVLDTHQIPYFDSYPIHTSTDDHFFHHRGFGTFAGYLSILYCVSAGRPCLVKICNPVSAYIVYNLLHCFGDCEYNSSTYEQALNRYHIREYAQSNTARVSGLVWKEIRMPKHARVRNTNLEHGLAGKLRFQQDEWERFNVMNMTRDSVVVIHDSDQISYKTFRPVLHDEHGNSMPPQSLGLLWTVQDSVFMEHARTDATVLNNPELRLALGGKLQFTEEEWSTFGVHGLSDDSYVQSEHRYFKPAVSGFQAFYNSEYTQKNHQTLDITIMPTHKNRRLIEAEISRFITENIHESVVSNDQFTERYLQGPPDTTENRDPNSIFMRQLSEWNRLNHPAH